ncbi:MAG: M23 family metallopeptidase [Holosporaceae bacterium]|jgi:murein DD-endopeptidase MepM/ murein hydrolase activator NlpD|nr:M23 family metallopeptidase [Holosporaceae bacterium]
MHKIIYMGVLTLSIVGCGRDHLSPVDIKIDEDMGYTAIGDVATEATHVVSGGETLFDVANKYNIDPINLAKINSIRSPYRVRNGQVLRLPMENFPAPVEKADEATNELPEEDARKQLEKELDDEFAGVMSTKNKASTGKATGTTFNDQENLLSTPKINKNAVGKPTTGATTAKVKPPVSSSGRMIYPTKGKIVSGFGDVKEGISNDGVNIKAALGSPVKAAADGDVIYAGNKLEEFGNTVIVQHDNNLITSYAHLKDMKVKNGQSVSAGDVIGSVGKTGDVAEPQLHFEVLKNKKPVNPVDYLPR